MMPLRAYLFLRFCLLGRLLREVGAWRLAFLGPLLVLAIGRGLVLAATHPPAQWVVPVLMALALAPAHRQRADLRFLATSAPAFRRWLAVEYGLATLPIAAVLVGFGHWGAAALTVALGATVAAMPPARESRSTRHRFRSLFRSEAFEWVSGLRAGRLWAWPLLLAGAIWQHQASPLGTMLALVGWLLVVLGCYGTPEPVTMLVVAARSARQLLRRRLLLGLGYAGLTAAPFFWLLAVGPVGGGGALAVAVVWLGLVGLMMLAKYAFYPNATHIRTTQGLVLAVALTAVSRPEYPVLMLVAVGGLIWQSRRRMRAVLGEKELKVES